jgi:hypothetical protein
MHTPHTRFGFVESLLDSTDDEVLVLAAFPRREDIRTLDSLFGL